MDVAIIITNYRVIFEPSFSKNISKGFNTIFKKQNRYIRDYFSVPLGQIRRCEKQLNPLIDQNQQRFGFVSHLAYQNQIGNHIELFTRDNRKFKIHFEFSQVTECKKIHELITKYSFFDMNYESLSKSFTWQYKMMLSENDIQNYEDGWDFNKVTIEQELLR